MSTTIVPPGGSGRNPLPKITSGFLRRNPDGTLAVLQPRPLFGGVSLEADVAAGDALERQDAADKSHPFDVRVTVNAAPQAVFFTLLYVQRQAGLASVAQVGRYASRTGARVLGRIAAIERLEQAWQRAYLEGVEEDLERFTNRTWPGFRALSAQGRYLKASVFFDVAGRLTNLAHATGLSTPTITLAALVAGLAQSERWVPDRYLERFARALLDFAAYLERRAGGFAGVPPTPPS